MTDEAHLIPDERLRLIFICCHPAVAPEARAALTLRLVCGLTVTEISRIFLVQRVWCARRSLEEPAPWPDVLHLYDLLLITRDDAIVRLNRAVALAEVEGPGAALFEVQNLASSGLIDFLPYHAVCADLLRRIGRLDEARAAYAKAIALDPPSAERRWLERRAAELTSLLKH